MKSPKCLAEYLQFFNPKISSLPRPALRRYLDPFLSLEILRGPNYKVFSIRSCPVDWTRQPGGGDAKVPSRLDTNLGCDSRVRVTKTLQLETPTAHLM